MNRLYILFSFFALQLIFSSVLRSQTDTLSYNDNGISFRYPANFTLTEVQETLPNTLFLQLHRDETRDCIINTGSMEIIKLLNDSLKDDFKRYFYDLHQNSLETKDKCINKIKNKEDAFVEYLSTLPQAKDIKFDSENVENEIKLPHEIGVNHKFMVFTFTISPAMSLIAIADNEDSFYYMDFTDYLVEFENKLYIIALNHIDEKPTDGTFKAVLSTLNLLNPR